MTRKTQKRLSLVLVFTMLLSILLASPFAIAAEETIAEWKPASSPGGATSYAATAGTAENTNATLTLSNGATISGVGTGTATNPYAYTSTGWQSGGIWWQLSDISTVGYSNVALQFAVQSSNTGPKNFAVEYSIDEGASWSPITSAGSPAAIVSANAYTPVGPFALSADADNCIALAIRVRNTDTTAVNDGVTAAAGTSRISNIAITGTFGGGGGTDPNPDPDPNPAPSTIPIASARLMPSGSDVIVEGVITRALQSSGTNTGNCTVYVQDETAGIAVFRSGITLNTYDIGARVRVSGTLSYYTGVLQIGTNVSIEVLDGPVEPIAPTLTNIAQLNSLALEGKLVKIEGVQIAGIASNSNHTVIDPTTGAETTMRCTEGTTLPPGFAIGDYIDVIGIAANYNGTAQLMVSRFIDITEGTEPLPIEIPDVDGSGTLAQWSLSTVSGTGIVSNGGDFESISTLQFIKDIAGTETPQTLNFSSGGANLSGLNGFANNAWWLLSTSGDGFANINISWNMRSSATGPRDFKLQYSADGTTWHDAIDPDIVVPSAIAINNTRYTKTLPPGANNLDTLYLRLLLTSDIAANGNPIGSGGTHQINFIEIDGDYIIRENQLKIPASNTASGAIPLEAAIAFVPDSTDALVQGYSILVSIDDGSTWNEASGFQYIVDALPLTMQVKATAPGWTDSRVATYSFTQAKLPMVTASRNSGAVIPGATIRLENTVSGAVIKYTINDGDLLTYENALVLSEELFVDGADQIRVSAWAEKAGYITGDATMFTYTRAITGGERVYFGQLHSHTTNSDGIGSLEEAYRYARDVADLDFFAVTDHSNSFDETGSNSDNPAAINLDAYNVNSARWTAGLNAAADALTQDFISVYGYEMTWSGGPGHINTFNTSGFVSRNNSILNGKANDSGMRAYYELLTRTPNSISMFNHPGTTFGNFNNFGYYDPVIDQRITLLEVGNGEGGIGSGGYWRSYEQYTLALDKGWHVAPTNNQDNHLGLWGNSNTARTAIWTNDLSVEGLYQAMRDMRVYATEVSDLEIIYKVNGQPLGSILDVVPPYANFTAEITNPTDGNYVKSISLISNGGVEILRETPNTQNYNYNKTITDPVAGYYYLRVVVATPEGDRIAVTAPVWLGQGKAAGFVDVAKSTVMPVTGESLTLTASLFNNESMAATLISLEYKDQRGNVRGYFDDLNMSIAPTGEVSHSLTYTPTIIGSTTVTVAALMRFADGNEQTYYYDITYEVWDAEGLAYIGIDASHYNEYVDGNYKDNMVNFTAIAAEYGVRVNILWSSADLIEACANEKYQALILTAPSRRVDPAGTNPTTGQVYGAYRTYSQLELDAIAALAARGGSVVLTGWSNVYENYNYNFAMPLEDHMASQQNIVLAALGSTLRLSDDAATDSLQWSSSTDPYRLYLRDDNDSYNWSSPLLDGVDSSQIFSQYGGSTLYAVDYANRANWDALPSSGIPSSVVPAVTLSSAGESVNRETSTIGAGNTNYRNDYTQYDNKFIVLASETLYHGDVTSQVIVAGGAFMSNFEVKIDMENAATLQYSNYNIALNLIRSIAPTAEITAISDAVNLPEGTQVTIEGIATTNVYSGNSATNTGFFDCIYVQDETGGINLFPVSSGVLEGQLIRVTGSLSEYMGETQIAVTRLEVIDSTINKAAPTNMTTEEAMLRESIGLLIKVEGTVSEIISTGGIISQFTVTDSSGVGALVFINAYITSETDLPFIENGARVSVVGLASFGENSSGSPLPRIRVRDRNEITFIEQPEVTVISATPSASVEKLPGNTNMLTVTVVETLSNGTRNTISATFRINNNAAGTYEVGDYMVYVNTKGNDQIRECYIVS